MVYPGKDKRVLRIVKKVIRGLSHYHEIQSAVSESQIWVDVLKYQVPDSFLSEMKYHHREEDIAEYRYTSLNDVGVESA